MHAARPCPPEVYLEAIALARLILPPDVHLQAPPNLSDDFGVLLDAGIDDWGGVSPVTADHVNPERPWPALDRLRAVTEAEGSTARPAAHRLSRVRPRPRSLARPGAAVPGHGPQRRRGPGTRRPWAVLVAEGSTPAAPEQVDDGVEVAAHRRRSTAWYAGTSNRPPILVPDADAGRATGAVARGPRRRARRATSRHRRDRDPVLRPRPRGGGRRRGRRRAARRRGRRRRHVRPQPQHQLHQRLHLQVPVLRLLQGPAVAQPAGHALPADARRHRRPRAVEAVDLGATEVCLQGGIHPDFDGDYYIDVARAVHEAGAGAAHPRVHRPRGHRRGQAARRTAGRVPEAAHGCRPARRFPAPRRRSSTTRSARCSARTRSNTEEWLDAHRTAHAVGPALQRHHHVRRRRAAARTGPATSCAPGTSRSRRAVSPSSCRCRSSTWPPRSTSSTRRAGARPSARRC